MVEDSTEPMSELLERWRLNSKRSQIANYKAAGYFTRLHYLIGIPSVVMSVIAGSLVFVGIGGELTVAVQITIGIISMLAAVLGALQTFLGLEQRSSKHKVTASEYGAIKRHVDQILASQNYPDAQNIEAIKDIRVRMNSLAREAPELPNHLWEKVIKSKGLTPKSIEVIPAELDGRHTDG